MLKAIRGWWKTPMAPRSKLMELRRECAELMTKNELLQQLIRDLDDDRAQRLADIEEARAERDAMRAERDEAVGKLDYVESKNAESIKLMDERERYVRFLEDELTRERLRNEDDFDDPCDECGMEIQDCDCDFDVDEYRRLRRVELVDRLMDHGLTCAEHVELESLQRIPWKPFVEPPIDVKNEVRMAALEDWTTPSDVVATTDDHDFMERGPGA